MNRFLPLLLCLLVGCTWAHGSTSDKTLKSKAARVKADPAPDPIPPSPNPPEPPPVVVPSVSLPATLTVKAGGWLFITAATNCQHVIWLEDDPENNLNVFPEELLVNKFVTVVSSMVPGEYRIMAVAAAADQPAESNWCVITVTGAQPPPAPPTPLPTPNPPTPNPPNPPAPVPVTAAKLLIVVITDANKPTTQVDALFSDPYFAIGSGRLVPADSLWAKGHRYVRYTSASTPAGVPVTTTYAAQIAANGGYPPIILMDQVTHKVLNSGADLALPASVSSFKTLIARYTSTP